MGRKFAMWTDHHFGKKQNSVIHNLDCLEFTHWFCQQVRHDPTITDIVFLGDYFESRSTIAIQTLDYAYEALKQVNKLGKPIWFIIGNHDLFRRSTREIYSTSVFQEFHNVQMVNEPFVDNGVFFSPFLFHDEYEKQNLKGANYAFGHFEFRGFAITGYNTIMDRGPEHKMWSGLKKIFSGHFHKRQIRDNVVYIGNVFPQDFGDVNDTARGMAIYDADKDQTSFIDWVDCPKYVKTSISKIIAGDQIFLPKTQVKCIIDDQVSYTEAQMIKEAMVTEFDLREFILEDDTLSRQELIEGETDVVAEEYNTIDETVVALLDGIKEAVVYNPKKLVEIYRSLGSG